MNTVYVFGAGASKGAGLPLMGNFLDVAKKIQDNQKENQHDKFDDVWKYIKNHKFEKYNIEDILGCLDMKISLDKSNSDVEIRRRFLEFILMTIKLSYYYGDYNKISNYCTLLKKFVNRLSENDTIISFNYDVLIDEGLNKNGMSPYYGIPLKDKETMVNNKRISLFKLHGSLNWAICPKCQIPLWYNYDYLLERAKTDKVHNAIHIGINLSFYQICAIKKKHKSNIQEETLIVPPSWNKAEYPFIKKLWKEASEKLKTADKIIFIGYSFSQTDTYFKYLLKSSLPKNIPVEVIDPNIEQIAERYLEIFKDNISFKAKTFEEYIENLKC